MYVFCLHASMLVCNGILLNCWHNENKKWRMNENFSSWNASGMAIYCMMASHKFD